MFFFTFILFETKIQDLQKQRFVARFSRQCWVAVLKAKEMGTKKINHYFFQWLRSNSSEEDIYQNLIDLEAGWKKLKDLNHKSLVSHVKNDEINVLNWDLRSHHHKQCGFFMIIYYDVFIIATQRMCNNITVKLFQANKHHRTDITKLIIKNFNKIVVRKGVLIFRMGF